MLLGTALVALGFWLGSSLSIRRYKLEEWQVFDTRTRKLYSKSEDIVHVFNLPKGRVDPIKYKPNLITK